MILLILLAASGLIVAVAVYNKKTQSPDSCGNPELEAFYDAEEVATALRLKKLLRAARYTIDSTELLEDKLESVTSMHKARLVSDEYYNGIASARDDLVIEKILIETEAEGLKAGARDALFSEASRLPRIRQDAAQKVKYFDEGIFLKRLAQLQAEMVK
ncbi:hypothetical protein PAPHI01_0636 [Pancytospora philotis]|nr:hypothetical protein PAPHI01_0636 [Pancytospora philotis]